MIVALQALYLFQKSLLAIFEHILEPYLKNIFVYKSTETYLEEDSDDEVYSEYDDNKGVVFYPPVYAQRYAAVTDCLVDTRWRGQLDRVIDFGCNDMSFIKCLKDIPGVREILGVDLEPILTTLDLKSDKYSQKRESPLKVTLYQGNAADPDYRLVGSDAVVAIELIEHMLPHDLERFVHNIFGFIKPWVVVITTPNGDFNVLFKALQSNGLRRLDHMFEWSREQFHDWCSNIVTRYPEYSVSCKGIGPGPPGTSHLGCCSQLALFVAANYEKQTELSPNSLAIVECASGSAMSDSMDSWDMTESLIDNRLHCTNNQVKRFSKTAHQLMAKNNVDNLVNAKDVVGEIRHLSRLANPESQESIWRNINWGEDAPYWNKYYKIMKEYAYPYAARSDETRILEVIAEEIHRLISTSGEESFSQNDKMAIPIGYIMGVVSHITDDEDKVRELLEWNGYDVTGDTVVYTKLIEDDSPVDVQEEWIDNMDSVSDWVTTDSGSLVVEPDEFDYDLQMSLENKIRSLLMLSARKDVSPELERLVRRLVELVRCVRERPRATRLLDQMRGLLAAMEDAVMKQRAHFIRDCKRAIKFTKGYKEDHSVVISIGIEKTCKAENILERYESILLGSDTDLIEHLECDHENELLSRTKMIDKYTSSDDTDGEIMAILEGYDSLLEELELRQVDYREIDKADIATSPSTDNIHMLQKKYKIAKRGSFNRAPEYLKTYNDNEEVIVIKAEPMRKRRKVVGPKNKLKHKKYKKTRKFTSFAPRYINYLKTEPVQYNQQKVKLCKKRNYYTPMCKSIKPIPSSLMNLFTLSENKINESKRSLIDDLELSEPESLLTLENQEDKSINCAIDIEPIMLKKFENNDTQSYVPKSVSCHTETNIQDTFGRTAALCLYDINEPSTSNGIRHICADIQCGPDDGMDVPQSRYANYDTLNMTPKRLYTGLKIQTSVSNFQNTKGTNTIIDAFDNNKAQKVKENEKCEQQDETKHVAQSVPKKQTVENNNTTVKPRQSKKNTKRSSLSYGAIYVHGYKNNSSEDIVYQGKWQECNLEKLTKKTALVHNVRRKESIVKKKIVIIEKDLLNKSVPTAYTCKYQKKTSYRNLVSPNHYTKVAHRNPEKKLDPSNTKKTIRHVRLETPTAVTKFFDTSQVFDIKNYIPAYLKRRLHKQPVNKKLNLNLNIALNTYKENKQLEKFKLQSVSNIQTTKYKPNSYKRKTTTYQVYRNEIDKEMITPSPAEDEKIKKCISASTSSYVPRSSCSNDINCRNVKQYRIDYSSDKSSSDCYEPGNHKNKIRRVRKLKSNNNKKTFITNVENKDVTIESLRILETETPALKSGVKMLKTSLEFSFSNDGLLKYNEVANTHSAHNTQTYECANKFPLDESERSKIVDTDTDDNIKTQIRHLINNSLSRFERFSTLDEKDRIKNIDQVAEDRESARSDYTSTLTLPTTSSSAVTEQFTGVQNKNDSKVSIGYSNIDSGVQDVELLSPISVASVTNSKYSEYLSADNEFEDFSSLNSNSILSLQQNSFAPKENVTTIDKAVMPVGVLNATYRGDLVDLNNVDSEIREDQEHSTQVFPDVSQRSSEVTYISCSTDDDTQIPYWLFESDSEPERLVTSLPLENETEDSEDETENATGDDTQEAVVGIGAGDGRGIHSDVSRDTSGRGTSLGSGTSSLESQETLSNLSLSRLSEYYVQPQQLPNNNEPANEPMETNDTPNL